MVNHNFSLFIYVSIYLYFISIKLLQKLHYLKRKEIWKKVKYMAIITQRNIGQCIFIIRDLTRTFPVAIGTETFLDWRPSGWLKISLFASLKLEICLYCSVKYSCPSPLYLITVSYFPNYCVSLKIYYRN